MSHCSSGKICYDSLEIAEEALLQHHARNNYAPGQGPVNVYECDRCGSYHFTSKGEIHPLLKDNKNRLDRLREANYWERKLR